MRNAVEEKKTGKGNGEGQTERGEVVILNRVIWVGCLEKLLLQSLEGSKIIDHEGVSMKHHPTEGKVNLKA